MLQLRSGRKRSGRGKHGGKVKYGIGTVSLSDLFNDLQQHNKRNKLIIIDIRNQEQFLQSYIISSIHIECSKLVGQWHTIKDFKSLMTIPNDYFEHKNLNGCNIVIITNNKQEKIDIGKQFADWLFDITDKQCNINLFENNQTFDDFEKKYPFLCFSNDKEKDNQDNGQNENKIDNDDNCEEMKEMNVIDFDYPNEIIDNKLYLGDGNQASNIKILKDLKITHIVNCTKNEKNHFEKDNQMKIEYLRVPVNDNNSDDLSQYFEKTFEFIDNALNDNNGNKVFVHCQMGVSRSATVVAAYIIKKKEMTFEKALEFLKTKRQCVQPSMSFEIQLKEYETSFKHNEKS